MSPTRFELIIRPLEAYLEDVLRPAARTLTRSLEVSVFQQQVPAQERLKPAEAAAREFVPVAPGWRWGPAHSSAWFRFDIVPVSGAPEDTVCFSCGSVGMAWVLVGGEWHARQGLGVERDEIALRTGDRGAERVTVLVEATCPAPITRSIGGERDRTADDYTPGEFRYAYLAIRDAAAWKIGCRFAFLLDLAKQLGEQSPRAVRIVESLSAFASDTSRSAASSLARLDELLHGTKETREPECIMCGLAHIESARWPLSDTRRECLRTFANQLELLDRREDYVFAAGQAQQYAWIEESSPETFARITRAVANGRWEPVGAMWADPDANVPSGESLVRQILLGVRYWRSRFGEAGAQSVLSLPDGFGFSACLPQIMRLAGLDIFITSSLSSHDTGQFSHATFVWRGIDGSEVLAHRSPARDAAGEVTPRSLLAAESACKDSARSASLPHEPPTPWLHLVGHDGASGGPTESMIECVEMAKECDGLPQAILGGFRDASLVLKLKRKRMLAAGVDFPERRGEFSAESRGFTLHAWLRNANRRAEEDLRFVEILEAGSPVPCELTRDKLDGAWKLLLLNQAFGARSETPSAEAREEAKRRFDRITKYTEKQIDRGTTRWLSKLSTKGMRKPVGVFNQTSRAANGVVQFDDGRMVAVKDVPALGVRVIDQGALHGWVPVKIDDHRMSNGIIEIELDGAGRLTRLARSGEAESSSLGSDEAPLNQLVLDADHSELTEGEDSSALLVDDDAESIDVVLEEPLRAAIRVTRALGTASRIEQTYVLDAGSPRIDVHTKVLWRESGRTLRALFPTGILAQHATYDIQFGHINRPTHLDAKPDVAPHDVCAHRWMDLSVPGGGLALLNDCKYGHSCDHGIMGLTLLRSSHHPEGGTDESDHEFTYSLMPHDGDWRAAGVAHQASLLNTPLIAFALNPEEEGALGTSWSPFEIATTGPCGIEVSALKRSEAGDGLVLRMWESHGAAGSVRIRWNLPAKSVVAASLLEEPLESAAVHHDTQLTTLEVRAFEIITLLIR